MSARITTPLFFRILGRLKHYVDLYPYAEKFFSRLEKEELTFIQAGANSIKLNDFIVLHGRRWKGYLLEPLPPAYDLLCQNYPHGENKIFEKVALSDHNGTLKLYCIRKTEQNQDWYTLFASADKDNYYLKGNEVDEFEVPCLTLDTFLQEKNVQELDLLYMNIEGHELRILNAYSFKLLPKIIFIETRFYSFIDLKDFYEKIIQLGYRVFPNRDFCLMVHKG
ncbi:MAG: FkbM family methyltransferase [Flavobacteriales bacterium]|nr:FkbM family methyltransferase [Flavobacteriales bacterium]